MSTRLTKCREASLTCLWSTTLRITEVTMQQMVLANMKIIILCQRHSGILVSLDGGTRRGRGQRKHVDHLLKSASLFSAVQRPTNSFYYLDLVPRICPTTRLETPIPTICMEVARPMAVPRVAWGTTRGMDGHMLACSHSRGVRSSWRVSYEGAIKQTICRYFWFGFIYFCNSIMSIIDHFLTYHYI